MGKLYLFYTVAFRSEIAGNVFCCQPATNMFIRLAVIQTLRWRAATEERGSVCICGQLGTTHTTDRIPPSGCSIPCYDTTPTRTGYTRWNEYLTRYDTRCHFNVRSKADISKIILPYGTKKLKMGKK